MHTNTYEILRVVSYTGVRKKHLAQYISTAAQPFACRGALPAHLQDEAEE